MKARVVRKDYKEIGLSTSEWELVKHNFQQSSSVNSEDDFNI